MRTRKCAYEAMGVWGSVWGFADPAVWRKKKREKERKKSKKKKKKKLVAAVELTTCTSGRSEFHL